MVSSYNFVDMQCPKCTNINEDAARFCRRCGAELIAAAPAVEYAGAATPFPQQPPGPSPLYSRAAAENPAWAPRLPDEYSEAASRLRPLSLGELFDETLSIYGRNFLKFSSVIAISVVPFIVFGIADAAPFARRFFSASFLGITPEAAAGYITWWVLPIAVFLALNVTVKMAADAKFGAEVSPRAALNYVAARLGALLFSFFLVCLVTCFAMIGMFVPGVVVIVMFIFSLHITLFEKRRAIPAMRRSSFLIQSFWWRTFFLIGFAFAFIITLSSLPSIATELLRYFISGPVRKILDSTLALGALVFTLPIATILSTAFYFDLRIRKEGLDLEIACDRLWP